MTEPTTPLMRQYHALKKQHPAALLLFRLGDFYELFFEDAVVASRILQITLTARNKKKGNAIPMCGVPYHAAENYIARLIRAGHKVAICEQMEQPGPGKNLVRREIVRVLTPGTASGAGLLEPKENNYLAAVARNGFVSAGAFGAGSRGVRLAATYVPKQSSSRAINRARIRRSFHWGISHHRVFRRESGSTPAR
jgi:DNA mismatch repair protein MutS